MKMSLTALAAAVALAASAPAHAFTPGTPTPFHLIGPMSFGFGPLGPVPCTADLTVDNTNNLITSATFYGSPYCASIVARGLPWAIVQDPTTPKVTILALSLNTPPGLCPPTTVVGAWNNTAPGTMTIPLTLTASACRIVSGSLSASPVPQTLP